MKNKTLIMVSVILCALSVLGVAPIHNVRTLRVGLFSVPPHVFPADPPYGASIDYIKQFAKDHKYHIEWVSSIPFPRLLALLKEGQIDIAPLISKTKERDDYLIYPNFPLFESKPVIIVNNDFRLKQITSAKRNPRNEFSVYSRAVLPSILKDPNGRATFTFMGTDNWIENGISLLRKRWVDGILSLNQYTIQYEIKHRGLIKELRAIELPGMGETDLVYIAISKKSLLHNSIIKDLNEWQATHSYEDSITPYLFNVVK